MWGLVGTLFGTKSGGQRQGIVILKKWPFFYGQMADFWPFFTKSGPPKAQMSSKLQAPVFRTPFWSFFRGVNFGTTIEKIGPLSGPVERPYLPYGHFFTKNIFSARLVLWPSRTAKKAPKGTRACFRSCGSALETVSQLSTPECRAPTRRSRVVLVHW